MVKVIGPHRTGSTIIQNIGYFILYKKQGRLKKNHSFEFNKKRKYLVTIRDPREMAISIYKKMILNTNVPIIIDDLSFLRNPKVKKDLEELVKIYNGHKNNKNSLILRYEDIYKKGLGNYDDAIKKISQFLDIEMTELEYTSLYQLLDYKKFKKISDIIETFSKNDVESTGYGLHGGHITSNAVKNWKNIIHKSLHTEYNNQLKQYIEDTEYII